MTEALRFQDQGFWTTSSFLLMVAGPSSKKSPVREEQPGPPLSQRTTGSFSGSLRDSKNPEVCGQSHVESKMSKHYLQ